MEEGEGDKVIPYHVREGVILSDLHQVIIRLIREAVTSGVYLDVAASNVEIVITWLLRDGILLRSKYDGRVVVVLGDREVVVVGDGFERVLQYVELNERTIREVLEEAGRT